MDLVSVCRQTCCAFLLGTILLLGACGKDSASRLAAADPAAGETVVLEIFSDPQCGACRRFYQENLQPAEQEFGGRGLKVVHHIFPLKAHQHAKAATLLYLAGDQLGEGGRSRVLAALFETQAAWSADGNIEAALTKALGAEQWALLAPRAASPEIAAELAREIGVVQQAGLRGTPTVVVHAGGEKQNVPSTVQYPIFRRYLSSLLES